MVRVLSRSIQAGDLNKRITIYLYDTTLKNEVGELDPDYVEYKKRWAKVDIEGGKNLIVSEKIVNRVIAKIIIRDMPGLDQKMRIAAKGYMFDISSIDDFEPGYKLLECYEDVV